MSCPLCCIHRVLCVMLFHFAGQAAQLIVTGPNSVSRLPCRVVLAQTTR